MTLNLVPESLVSHFPKGIGQKCQQDEKIREEEEQERIVRRIILCKAQKECVLCCAKHKGGVWKVVFVKQFHCSNIKVST